MRSFLAVVALVSLPMVASLGCGRPRPAPLPAVPPAAPVASVAPVAPAPSAAPASTPAVESSQRGPLASLPYTPGLDVAAMDRSADPCTSLYEYSCGGWMKDNPIPADQASWSVGAKTSEENKRFLWGVLADLQKPAATRTPSQQKIGDYFAACMDESGVEAKGAAPLKPWLDAIDAVGSVHDLAPLLARMQVAMELPSGLLFSFGSEQDASDAERTIAVASAGGLGLPDRDYYVQADAKSQELRAKYVAHVTAMLSLTGSPPDVAAREAAAILRIETDLAAASLTSTERRDPHKVFHKTTREALVAMTPAFDWAAFLGELGLGEVRTLNVAQPAFFQRMEKELRDVPLADWKSYLRWHLVHEKARNLSSPFVRADFEFYGHTLHGTPALAPRWNQCVTFIDEQLGEALGEEFVRRTAGPETKARVLAMTLAIERAMADDITHATWMGAKTKEQALRKLHAIVNKIGYPDHFRDYAAVVVAPDDFAGDAERALAFEARRQLAKIGKPVDRSEWFITPQTVDAYYDPQMNDINFPTAILLPPFFDPKMDDAPNYGNTGSTIGHELTHAFDDEGRQFDGKGNLRDWWTKADALGFDKKASCVVDQYAQYTVVDDVKINSKLTQGEDLADLGGSMLAYAAWKQATAGATLQSADGLTPDQRFFVGFAQWACANERPENLRLRAVTDPHSPFRYRVDGVVANMPEYRSAFACHAGQPMVRETPCRVW